MFPLSADLHSSSIHDQLVLIWICPPPRCWWFGYTLVTVPSPLHLPGCCSLGGRTQELSWCYHLCFYFLQLAFLHWVLEMWHSISTSVSHVYINYTSINNILFLINGYIYPAFLITHPSFVCLIIHKLASIILSLVWRKKVLLSKMQTYLYRKHQWDAWT